MLELAIAETFYNYCELNKFVYNQFKIEESLCRRKIHRIPE